MTKRRLWLLVHRVNGLLLAAFLTIVGVTGAILVYKAPLERLFAPALFRLAAHGSGVARADPVLVRQAVARAFPWAEVDMLDLSTKTGVPVAYGLTPKETSTSAWRDDEAYADPYSGRVLGARRDGDLRQGLKNVVPFVYELHENLALGEGGTWLLGLAALLWTFDCFVGLYLTFPASHRRVAPPLKRGRQWPARWLPSWRIRFREGAYKRLHDLHRAGGLWFWVLLLVFAWTGVVFDLPVVARPILHFLGDATEPGVPAGCGATSAPAGEMEWRAALVDARRRMQQAAARESFGVREERFLSYDRDECIWTYRVRSTRDVDQIGNTQLRWSSMSASAVFTAPTGISRAGTVNTWMEAMHEAQIGGPVFRLVVCISGLMTALLSVTGVLIFLRKQRARRDGSFHRP